MQSARYRVQRLSGRGSTKPASYRLAVWEKAQALADGNGAIIDELPRIRSADIVANQVLRSSSSRPANIAEGYGRYSEPAYRSFLSMARGSLYETESTIDLIRRRGLITQEICNSLVQEAEEGARLITATLKPLKPLPRSPIREDGPEYVRPCELNLCTLHSALFTGRPR